MRRLTAADPRLVPLMEALYAMGLPRHATRLRIEMTGPNNPVQVDCTFEPQGEDDMPMLKDGAIVLLAKEFVLAEKLPGHQPGEAGEGMFAAWLHAQPEGVKAEVRHIFGAYTAENDREAILPLKAAGAGLGVDVFSRAAVLEAIDSRIRVHRAGMKTSVSDYGRSGHSYAETTLQGLRKEFFGETLPE